jgi:hypothetical protein
VLVSVFRQGGKFVAVLLGRTSIVTDGVHRDNLSHLDGIQNGLMIPNF